MSGVSQTQKNLSSLWLRCKALINDNLSLLIAFSLALLAGLFFFVIGYPSVFSSIAFFRQRWFGLSIFGLSLVIVYLGCYYSHWKLSRSLSVGIQSVLLQFFSFAYFLRLNNAEFRIGELVLTTGLVFLPLVLLIFLVNFNLFGSKKRVMYLVVPQVLLFCLQTFSYLSFLDLDRTDFRDFSQDWLNIIFNLPTFVWVVGCALAIGMVSMLNLHLTRSPRRILLASVFTIAVGQILFILYNLNYSYWYQTLLFLIVWDFLYAPYSQIVLQISDPKYRPKLVISSIYHAFLFFIVLILA